MRHLINSFRIGICLFSAALAMLCLGCAASTPNLAIVAELVSGNDISSKRPIILALPQNPQPRDSAFLDYLIQAADESGFAVADNPASAEYIVTFTIHDSVTLDLYVDLIAEQSTVVNTKNGMVVPYRQPTTKMGEVTKGNTAIVLRVIDIARTKLSGQPVEVWYGGLITKSEFWSENPTGLLKQLLGTYGLSAAERAVYKPPYHRKDADHSGS